MTSAGSEVVLDVSDWMKSDDVNVLLFIDGRLIKPLHCMGMQSHVTFMISVFGCGDMTPPDGAWMTRDGDVIEIGCHSGSKTWTLECIDNLWKGVLGQCGSRTS